MGYRGRSLFVLQPKVSRAKFCHLMGFWEQRSHEYASMELCSLAEALHPSIATIVEGLTPTRILDFGCGDGRLLEILDCVRERHAYDVNPAMLDFAKSRLREKLTQAHSDLESIPRNYFDVVICSLVLMMIRNEDTYLSTTKTMAETVLTGGFVVVAITHPCFRNFMYSDFETEYSSNDNLDYFADGQPFSVKITDDKSKKQILFQDFHWSLSFTINSLVAAGLRVVKVLEIRDALGKARSNPKVPPYLVIVTQRMSMDT